MAHPTDDRLLAHLLYADATHGQAQLTNAWREVNGRYATVGDTPGDELVAVYDHLRTGQEKF